MSIRNFKLYGCAFLISFFSTLSVSAADMEDNRVLIKLPNKIEEKFLQNMRDHIGALDDIVHAVRAGEFEKAKIVASSRLAWSSFVHDENDEIAKHLPIPMRKMAEQMYDATGKFIWLAQNASVEESTENYRNLFEALGNFTTTCRSCHETYRLR